MPASNRLCVLRQEAKVSKAALGRELGVDTSTIWRWEHERSAIPDAQKIALAERFDVTIGYLMGWDTEGQAAA